MCCVLLTVYESILWLEVVPCDLSITSDRANSHVSVANEENVVGGCAAMVLINGVVGTTLVASYHHDCPAFGVIGDGATCPSSIVVVTGTSHKENVLTLGVEAGR